MLFRPVLAALNHLLAQSGWAQARLTKFSGKTAHFNIAPFSFACTVLSDGSMSLAMLDPPPDATFTISPALLPRLALHEEGAFQQIESSGDAVFVAEILYIARHLRWDAAEDLSRATGDIAAERLVQLASIGTQQLREAGINLAQAATEYWTEERPLLARPAAIVDFCQQVDGLEQRMNRLEQRLQLLSES